MLLRIEQGRMVDRGSSLEIKRYLYMTRKRYRYVYAPELAEAAVYFKSGSYYKCTPEEGYACGPYRGNVKNYLNSVAIVESPATPGPGQRRYSVALMSDVLNVKSAWDHCRLGGAIEEIIRTRGPPPFATRARTPSSPKREEGISRCRYPTADGPGPYWSPHSWHNPIPARGFGMPIYEFVCRSCGESFETLVLGSRQPSCPKCNGTRLEKQMSAFAFRSTAGTESGGFASPASKCTGCAAKSCSTCR